MKIPAVLISLGMISVLSACSGLPEECLDYWSKIEKISKQMGMSETQIKNNRIEFEEKMRGMNKEDAVQACSMQSSFLNLAKDES